MSDDVDMTDENTFELAEISISFLAPASVFAELEKRVQEMLETTFESTVWQMSIRENLTDDPDHRENYAGLFEQVEIESEQGTLGKPLDS